MKKRGYELSDTMITGVMFILKDGSKKVVKAKNPIIYKTKKELNNGKRL